MAMVGYGRHSKQCGMIHIRRAASGYRPSNWILTLIATALSSVEVVEAMKFCHPTCDPGADQMTSMRNAGPVEIVRNDKFLVGNAAQERSFHRFI